MKTTLRTVVVLLAIAATFVGGAVTAIQRHWDQPLVSVAISNRSGQEIDSLVVAYTSYGFKGTVEVMPPPKPGSGVTVYFFHRGEGGFTVTATLRDGKTVQGIGGYIESGYSSSMVVTTASITGGLI